MKRHQNQDLTTGDILHTLITFTLPILFSNLLQQLYSIADSAIVGRLIGKDALAAVGASYQISSIILAISMGITIGMSILISRYFGSKEYDQIQKAVDSGIFLCTLLSIVITVFGAIGAYRLLSFFQIPSNILPQAGLYFTIICFGTYPSFLYNAATNYLRGVGNTSTALFILCLSSLINIVLDIVLIQIVHLGVVGAALATIISQFTAFFMILSYGNHHNLTFRLHLICRPDSHVLWHGLRIGIPATLQQLFIGLGNSVIQIMINYYGSAVIAAFTATSKLEGFVALPTVNIGRAISNFIAQNNGAGENDRTRKGIQYATFIVVIFSILISFIIFIFRNQLLHLFCSEESVCTIGSAYFSIVCAFYIIFGFMQLMNGILLGVGKSGASLIGSILSFCAFQVPIAISLSKIIGIKGIWLAAPMGWIAGLLLRLLFYLRYQRQSKKQDCCRSDLV